MKHYYFMNKPEVVEEKEYEQEGGYIKYYYKKGEWELYKRPRKNTISSNLKKQRNIFYIFSVLFIILLAIVWKTTDENNPSTYYNKQNKLLFFFKTGEVDTDNKQIIIYIQNTLDKQIQINKNFISELFYTKENKKILIKTISRNINRDIKPKENISIGEAKIEKQFNNIGIIINKTIILQETKKIQ